MYNKYCILNTGTFHGNNDGDRAAMSVPTRTTSLWSFVNRPEVLSQYLNPMYEPNQHVIWPSVAPMSLVSFQIISLNIFYYLITYY